MKRGILFTIVLIGPVLAAGCVERRYTIRTEPAGARIVLDGEEIGLSPQTIDFIAYGTHEVVITHSVIVPGEKPGTEQRIDYATVKQFVEVAPPWWQTFPIDIFPELFYPGTLVDEREFLFTLTPAPDFDEASFLERAAATRARGQK